MFVPTIQVQYFIINLTERNFPLYQYRFISILKLTCVPRRCAKSFIRKWRSVAGNFVNPVPRETIWTRERWQKPEDDRPTFRVRQSDSKVFFGVQSSSQGSTPWAVYTHEDWRPRGPREQKGRDRGRIHFGLLRGCQGAQKDRDPPFRSESRFPSKHGNGPASKVVSRESTRSWPLRPDGNVWPDADFSTRETAERETQFRPLIIASFSSSCLLFTAQQPATIVSMVLPTFLRRFGTRLFTLNWYFCKFRDSKLCSVYKCVQKQNKNAIFHRRRYEMILSVSIG